MEDCLPSGHNRAGCLTEHSTQNDCDGKAVVALAADRLQHGCTEARLGGNEVGESPHTLDIWIGAFGVNHFAVADDVVGYDNGSDMGELQGPLEICRIAALVGVDEDEIEGRGG